MHRLALASDAPEMKKRWLRRAAERGHLPAMYELATECGEPQERRRWLKQFAVRMPLEPWLWFLYHYVARLGFLEGRPGLIASQIRRQYIANVRAKMYELKRSGASR